MRGIWNTNTPATALLAVLLLSVVLVGLSATPSSADSAGYALVFDGTDDYVRLGDTGDLCGQAAWTDSKSISIWIKPTGATAPTVPNFSSPLGV